MPGETTDARKRHAEFIRTEDVDRLAISICGFSLHELLAIRDGLHRAGNDRLLLETARARAQADTARALARELADDARRAEARAEKAEAALAEKIRTDNLEAFKREAETPLISDEKRKIRAVLKFADDIDNVVKPHRRRTRERKALLYVADELRKLCQ